MIRFKNMPINHLSINHSEMEKINLENSLRVKKGGMWFEYPPPL